MRFGRLAPISMVFVLALAGGPAWALTAEDVNGDVLRRQSGASGKRIDPLIVKAQVLLSRKGISPGVIDGFHGQNYRKALAQFRRQERLGDGDKLDEKTWQALGGDAASDIVEKYEVSREDAGYDFADEIPRDFAEQAAMKRLSFKSPEEMLSERFHMGEKLLKALNPGVDYGKAGEAIAVVSVKREPLKGPVERIDAIKSTGMILVFGAGETILASYPASIGSRLTPSPEGEHRVERIAKNPTYHYDPDKNFQQGKNTQKLVLPPGPNSPVGTVWIALSKPTFGIHGTAEPSQVSKTTSHGCVRLTNWDAEELAEAVKPGVPVRFVQD